MLTISKESNNVLWTLASWRYQFLESNGQRFKYSICIFLHFFLFKFTYILGNHFDTEVVKITYVTLLIEMAFILKSSDFFQKLLEVMKTLFSPQNGYSFSQHNFDLKIVICKILNSSRHFEWAESRDLKDSSIRFSQIWITVVIKSKRHKMST